MGCNLFSADLIQLENKLNTKHRNGLPVYDSMKLMMRIKS